MSAVRVHPMANAIFDVAYSKIQVEINDLPDHTIMRARQLASLLLAMQDEDGPDALLYLAQQISDEIVACIEASLNQKGAI